jgi:transposase
MNDTDLFQMALGLIPPWLVKRYTFDAKKKRLDIYLDFTRGGTFTCHGCGLEGCKAYDTVDKTWRHLNFFEHVSYLHARVPRTNCDRCGIGLVSVPWARDGSGFTLLFEAFIMVLARDMPVNAIARLVKQHDTRLWRVLRHYVDQARKEQDYSGVTRVGVDETSSKKGHHYISIFVDMDQSKVMFATPGKGAQTLEAFKDDFEAHGGWAGSVQDACCDMSPAFISGLETTFENAQITFDKFHVVKVLNAAVDEVRREEQKERPELKKTRWVWLKNEENQTDKEYEVFESLKNMNWRTIRATHLKINFQELYAQPKEAAEKFLKKWYFWAIHSRIEPMLKAAKTIKRHWDGVLRWFESRLTNGLLEGLNSLVQAAKARARGYRSTRNFITMVYIIAGKLDFHLPT